MTEHALCPWCGSEGEPSIQHLNGHSNIYCITCEGSGPRVFPESEDGAWAAWDSRWTNNDEMRRLYPEESPIWRQFKRHQG